jgi:hypothetical protein
VFHSVPNARRARAGELDFSDRRYFARRLIRRLNLARRLALRPATRAGLVRLSEPANQSRMVFVVGAARSGTTAMLMALNGSDDAFLLTEANLYLENLLPKFRQRYNARHRANGLPPSKHFECPAVAPEGSTWVEIMLELLSRHRLVGEKVAFGHYQVERFIPEYLAFQHRHFHQAAYILMFRNPRDTILSVRTALGVKNLAPWALSYTAAMRGLIRLRRHFPRTVPVFLETIDPPGLEAIERSLSCPLSSLSAAISRRVGSPHIPEPIPIELSETVADLQVLYAPLREAIESAGSSSAAGSLDSIDARLAQLSHRLREICRSMTMNSDLAKPDFRARQVQHSERA